MFPIITNRGKGYYKSGQELLQIGEDITNRGRFITNRGRYYKSGQLLQIGAEHTLHKWDSSFLFKINWIWICHSPAACS